MSPEKQELILSTREMCSEIDLRAKVRLKEKVRMSIRKEGIITQDRPPDLLQESHVIGHDPLSQREARKSTIGILTTD